MNVILFNKNNLSRLVSLLEAAGIIVLIITNRQPCQRLSAMAKKLQSKSSRRKNRENSPHILDAVIVKGGGLAFLVPFKNASSHYVECLRSITAERSCLRVYAEQTAQCTREMNRLRTEHAQQLAHYANHYLNELILEMESVDKIISKIVADMAEHLDDADKRFLESRIYSIRYLAYCVETESGLNRNHTDSI